MFTPFLFQLNSLQPAIRRNAGMTIAWNATLFKLTHSNAGLISLVFGVGIHRNQVESSTTMHESPAQVDECAELNNSNCGINYKSRTGLPFSRTSARLRYIV